MMKRAVTIYTESNPNPNSLKFVADFMLTPEGLNKDYPSIKETENAPLAKALFKKFDFIERIFYMNNFVTITKKEEIDWFEVKGKIQQFIQNFLQENDSILAEEEPDTIDITENETEIKIKAVLDEYIKPAVEMDGGAIGFASFKDGILKVVLQGSCSGCPSSVITLKSGIENLMKRMVPEVKEVVAEDA